MPELPEVHTTVQGIKSLLKGVQICDVWTSYKSSYGAYKNSIKNPSFFSKFRKEVISATIIDASRRGKNILIHLSNEKTILVHMKMTGHMIVGEYEMSISSKDKKDPWKPVVTEREALKDPFNRHIRLIFTLKGGSTKKMNVGGETKNFHLILSDMRRFAKVTILPTPTLHESVDLKHIGPEPLESKFTYKDFEKIIGSKDKGKIKTILMDQTLIAGIGNIYSDEMLWRAGIHPESTPSKIPTTQMKKLFVAMREVLNKGIDFGGDSMSDYRNIHGERGKFQTKHQAYRKTGLPCEKRGCAGHIIRKVIGSRSGHFCDTHQFLYS